MLCEKSTCASILFIIHEKSFDFLSVSQNRTLAHIIMAMQVQQRMRHQIKYKKPMPSIFIAMQVRGSTNKTEKGAKQRQNITKLAKMADNNGNASTAASTTSNQECKNSLIVIFYTCQKNWHGNSGAEVLVLAD